MDNTLKDANNIFKFYNNKFKIFIKKQIKKNKFYKII